MKIWVFIAGLMGAGGVAALAFQSHALPALVQGDELRLRDFASAADLMRYNALALLGAALLTAHMRRGATLSAALFTLGTLLFAAPLFSFSLTGQRHFMWLAPIGGTITIAAWLALAVCALWGLIFTERQNP